MDDLKDLFVNEPPRETSGPLASDRFEYQKDWSLVLLLKLHLAKDDYLLILDMHEDVVVFDSSSDPKTAKFYQVKTLYGKGKTSWTTGALIKRQKGKTGPKNSILGKLYSNKLKFKADAKRLAVVSNAPFAIELTDGKQSTTAKKSIAYVEIHPDDREKIEKALEKELSLSGAPELNGVLFLDIADLYIKKHSEHARGKLVDFLDEILPDHLMPVPTIYRLLIGEIRIKNDTIVQASDFSELAKLKGISRADFQKILERTGAISNPKKTLEKIESDMEGAGLPIGVRVKMRFAFRQVQVDRTNKQSTIISEMHSRVAKTTARLAEQATTSSVYELSKLVLEDLKVTGFDIIQFPEDYIRVLAMISFHETGNI
jgi:DNA-binding Lrp family transcriptional regulator